MAQCSSPAGDLAARAQGLVLDCSELEWEPLERLPAAAFGPDGAPDSSSSPGGSSSPGQAGASVNAGAPVLPPAPPVWLALDEVMDPVSFRV